MHEKYHYKSNWFYIAAFGMVASSLSVPLLIVGIAMSDQEVLGFSLFIGWFIVIGAVLFLLERMPASFHAEADSITFCLLFRKICIPYSSISSMEVTRYYDRPLIRGGIPHYVEELHIVCNDVEYNFHAPMQIDMEKIAIHPEKLQDQFEDGIFRRLQLYIESHRSD